MTTIIKEVKQKFDEAIRAQSSHRHAEEPVRHRWRTQEADLKVAREKARKNHDLVIETAARLLRERGLQGIGLADIMQAAGLTHGGFYRNFASREDLMVQASARAAASVKAATLAALTQSPADPFRTLVKTYVSRAHRDRPGAGCLLPALASDAARKDNPDLRALFAAVIQDYLDQLAKMTMITPPNRHPGAVLSEMVGAVILARVVPDDMADLLIGAVVRDLVGASEAAQG